MLPVTMKEVPSATIYYGIYHYLKEKDVSILLSGSLAGVASWFSIYPLDTIKTRLQAGTATNVKDAFRQGNLWKGLNLCLLRAFITNGIGFYVYEKSAEIYRNY
jgi:solute carrier family 25 carnitine/acylcarnitine transporter 20/29